MRKEFLVPSATLVLALAITGCQAKLAQSPYGQKEEAWGKVIKENYSDWSPPPTVPPDRGEPATLDAPPVVLSSGEEAIEITSEPSQPDVAQPVAQPPAVAAPAPDTVSTPPAGGEFQTYTVEPKDTLWGIAKRFYGSGKLWTRIFDANRDVISSPRKLKIGSELKIPSAQ